MEHGVDVILSRTHGGDWLEQLDHGS